MKLVDLLIESLKAGNPQAEQLAREIISKFKVTDLTTDQAVILRDIRRTNVSLAMLAL